MPVHPAVQANPWIARADMEACLLALIDGGAYCHPENAIGAWVAASQGLDGCLARLLGSGVDPDHRPFLAAGDLSTLATLAANGGHLNCLRALASAGSDLAAAGQRGETPFDVATRLGHKGCADFIELFLLSCHEMAALASTTACAVKPIAGLPSRRL